MNVSEDEAEEVVKDLKGELPAGIDGVPDLTVEECMKFTQTTVTGTCSASMESGIFPDRLKLAIVKHLLKKGDTENIQNYSPISLVFFFSKILESVMYTRLFALITKRDILTEAQNGFR
jgi:hypothetical protein